VLSLVVSPTGERSLVDQIVGGVKLQIEDRRLAPGSKLPSIRDLAKTLNISRFTVVEAYDRLVAMGYLQSRRGAGFYVAALAALAETPAPLKSYKRNEQLLWLVRQLLDADENAPLAAHGCQIPG
jgi:DNA-binding GntR family transcriptional regulator